MTLKHWRSNFDGENFNYQLTLQSPAWRGKNSVNQTGIIRDNRLRWDTGYEQTNICMNSCWYAFMMKCYYAQNLKISKKCRFPYWMSKYGLYRRYYEKSEQTPMSITWSANTVYSWKNVPLRVYTFHKPRLQLLGKFLR